MNTNLSNIPEGARAVHLPKPALDVAVGELLAIADYAAEFLHKIDHITTDEFSKGGEQSEREQLRAALEMWMPDLARKWKVNR